MRVTLAQLEAFVSIARHGSVRAASRRLNLAQPTVSLRLRDLEIALGMRLFDRSGRGLRLSAIGMNVLEHAERVLAEMGKLKGLANDGQISGRLRFGVSESFAMAGLPALLKLVAKDYPQLHVDLVIGPSPDLVRDVLEHRLDLAMAVNPPDDIRLKVVSMGVQPATWAAAPSLNLPPIIRPADILHHTILVNPSPYPNWHQTMSWFGTAGLEPLHVSVCSTVPSIIAHLVEEGLGVGILPTKLIEPLLRAGTLVAVGCRPSIEKSHLCAVSNVGNRQPASDAVINAARRVIEDLNLLELPPNQNT